MIETIHDVGECTNIEELQNQIDNYNPSDCRIQKRKSNLCCNYSQDAQR